MKTILSYILTLLFISSLSAQIQFNRPDPKPSFIALKNANILDFNSNKFQKADLLIKNERIESISYKRKLDIPSGTTVYDLEGKYIIPGLIDAHVHITHGTLKEAQGQLNLALKQGVTSVRDMGGDGRMLTLLKRNMRIGENVGPDVFFQPLLPILPSLKTILGQKP